MDPCSVRKGCVGDVTCDGVESAGRIDGTMGNGGASVHRPVAMGSMSRASLDAALAKGMASLETGRGMSPDEVDAALRQEFGA